MHDSTALAMHLLLNTAVCCHAKKCLFSKYAVVLFARCACNLLNSRQLSFINQVFCIKSYKEQTKLTLFCDRMPIELNFYQCC